METKNVTRRDFIKIAGAAGAGSMLSAGQVLAQVAAEPAPAALPARTFGKTGVKVPMLALGGIFDIVANQLVLQRALDFGVTYWDTANGYTNGNSEKGIGMYFEKHPEVRKRIFLVSKAGTHDPARLSEMLEESLRRMKTDYIDLYFLHGIGRGEDLTPDVKAWAEKAKAANKIRFFGFSTHGNMENSLQAAAKLGWIDGIMLKYDFRLMSTDNMRAATEACANAGIGLTAMKTQGGGPLRAETDADLKLGGHFIKRGFTDKQAKLKAVWDNSQIAAICSQMSSITVLESNVAAAHDKTKLTAADRAALHRYALETHSQFCAGCTHLCEPAAGRAPIGDALRCLMYHRVYGDPGLAQETFAGLAHPVANVDYTAAEAVCPQRLPIARLMREASALLG